VIDLKKLVGFDWDQWNFDKSYQKHGITPKEAEELFLDENVLIIEDLKHSEKEKRSIAIGKTAQDSVLFAVFTVRNLKIRIISVRAANNKERRQYEEI
jgi:hypothetical protein